MHKYDEDFKKTIVSFAESGKTVRELSEEYSISPATIKNWKKLYKKIGSDSETENDINLKEFRKLQKKYAELQEENEVLKKFIAIFSKN